jgi:hypothetical protein
MGKTIAEKILAKASAKKDVSPGEYIFLTSRCPVPGIGRGREFFKDNISLFDPPNGYCYGRSHGRQRLECLRYLR